MGVRWRDLSPEFRERMRHAKILNGCGPKASWANYLIPDRFLGLCLQDSCEHHDFNYTIGNTESDRIKADRQFYVAMRERALILTTSWFKRPFRPIYRLVAWTYYKAVSRFGKKFFYYGDAERTMADLEKLLEEAEKENE